MQHILCSKERGKRFVAWLMTAIMLLFVMASALPAAQAVTQDEIDVPGLQSERAASRSPE